MREEGSEGLQMERKGSPKLEEFEVEGVSGRGDTGREGRRCEGRGVQ